ncbi:hypothetical protein EVG20_g11009 [Dentipellis fragilis]|uniref:Uncharacterized protein n=1 Tax=Dentipellis fragilis TaxID=205917 RepID=A0A4Y9XPY3_9AGAM|nr:hypothetical protein EVG20_g11009 [Dentipellis fragilis]
MTLISIREELSSDADAWYQDVPSTKARAHLTDNAQRTHFWAFVDSAPVTGLRFYIQKRLARHLNPHSHPTPYPFALTMSDNSTTVSGPSISIAPYNKFSLIGIWIETALWEAFVYIPVDAPPLYSTLYWVNESDRLQIMNMCVYTIAICISLFISVKFLISPRVLQVWVQDLILIWCMYVIWRRNPVMAIAALIVETAHIASAFAGAALLMKPGANPYSPTLKRLGPVGWSLDLAVNICVMGMIAGRLWWMGHKVASISSRGRGENLYLSMIFTFVESGGIFAAVTIVMLMLYEVGSPLALTGIAISMQLAVFTPLLLIIRVGLGLTHRLPRAYEDYLSSISGPSPWKVASNHIHIAMDQNIRSDASLHGSHEYPMQQVKDATPDLGAEEV